MSKKWIAAIMALVLCLGLLTGCAGDDGTIDSEKAYKKYKPDTLVMTINGDEINWTEFFYMMNSGVSQLTYYTPELVWDDTSITGSVTNEEYVMRFTMEGLQQFHLIHNKAKELNVQLTAEEEQGLADMVQAYKDTYLEADATDEEFDAFLESIYMNREVFDYVNRVAYEYNHVFSQLVGNNGEQLSDEDIAAYVEKQPFVTAKHILLKTVDDAGAALPADQIEAARVKANELYDQLKNIKDTAKLSETFDKLLEEHNEDEGMAFFPGGYTFTTGEMVPEFETATFALEENAVSEPVLSQFGYHIILRLPTTRDSVVEYMTETNGYTTVGYYAAVDAFNSLLYAWMDECDIVWADGFKDFDIAKIY